MTDDEKTMVDPTVTPDNEPQKKTVLVRVHEWSAWIPQQADGQLWMSSGLTGFEAHENEKVLEVAVSSTPNQKFFPQPNPDDPDGQPLNVRHGLYAFQAILASNFDGPVPEGPTPDGPINLPRTSNREQRRKKS